MKTTLSKSQYLKGLQCPKALWFYNHRKDLKPEIDAATQARFDVGNELGVIAQNYFSGGIEVIADYWDIQKAEAITRQFIKDGHKLIYEATAIHPVSGFHSRIDILRKVDGADEWDLIEVKSSTSVKDYHIDDLSFQYYVFHKAGFKVRNCFMMVIDNQYKRNGDIEPQALLKLVDITEQVLSKQDEIDRAAPQLLEVIANKSEPETGIGARCKKPFECDYKAHCWKHVPEYSIFNIFSGVKAERIADSVDSYDVKDIPSEMLPVGNKLIDISSYREGTIFINSQNIAQFLSRLEYPLYYLDYETLGPAIPAYNGTSPYQAIPFQFSLHIQVEPGGSTHHHEFLYKEPSDPRRAFTKKLIELCGASGSIIVWNQGFEKGRNEELAKEYPEFAVTLNQINDRMLDLLVPFRNRALYHPQQKGSASLKNVLPAFTELGYQDMAIGGGSDASSQYQNFVEGKLSDDETDSLWQDLSKYCKLDTHAMVELLKVLNKYSD